MPGRSFSELPNLPNAISLDYRCPLHRGTKATAATKEMAGMGAEFLQKKRPENAAVTVHSMLAGFPFRKVRRCRKCAKALVYIQRFPGRECFSGKAGQRQA
jgi:hypothetical protein